MAGHQGHKCLAEMALKRFRLDAIWWMVTPANPIKGRDDLACLEDRINQSRALVRHPRIHITGFEAGLEQFPKSVQRFSDKNCGENKGLEQISDSIESHSALKAKHAAQTVDTIALVRKYHPRNHFVWLMGADNLGSFHLWQQWRMLANMVSIGIIDRPGATFHALSSPAARALSRFRLPETHAAHLARQHPPAWCFLYTPRLDISSSSLRLTS